jgi:hypothetical protein
VPRGQCHARISRKPIRDVFGGLLVLQDGQGIPAARHVHGRAVAPLCHGRLHFLDELRRARGGVSYLRARPRGAFTSPRELRPADRGACAGFCAACAKLWEIEQHGFIRTSGPEQTSPSRSRRRGRQFFFFIGSSLTKCTTWASCGAPFRSTSKAFVFSEPHFLRQPHLHRQ